MNPFLPASLRHDGHAAMAFHQYGGMGDPGWFESHCSCGWQGSTWNCPRLDIDEPLERHGYLPEWQERYAQAGGIRGWNQAHPESRIGGEAQALGEILAHLGISPQQAQQSAEREAALREAALREAVDSASTPGADLDRAVEQITTAHQRWSSARNLAMRLPSMKVDTTAGLPRQELPLLP